MNVEPTLPASTTTVREQVSDEVWSPWPVSWSAIIVGMLTAIALGVIIGLVALAIGAHILQRNPFARLEPMEIGAIAFAIGGAFFSFVAGGWVAGKIAGIRRSETAMLHGAIVWVATVPVIVIAAIIGASSSFGYWYGGITANPEFVTAVRPTTDASGDTRANADRDAQRVTRNSALGALTTLLVGLMGGVIGGWMASGEPMTFTYYRTRPNRALGATNTPGTVMHR